MLTTLLAVVAFAPKAAVSPWEKEVIYQIFPRSFCDSNGDRIGDFKGIESKLGYLQSLGITTILLNPIVSSRTYHNYFADDFLTTDRKYGTNAQFWDLVRAAHHRRLKVLLDMEPQYVADGHPWYRAVVANPAAKEHQFLWQIGTALIGPNIHWWDKQSIQITAINPDNSHVRDYVRNVFRYWTAPNGKVRDGVDGFRIDHMMDDLDLKGEKKGMLKKFWAPIEKDIRAINPKIFFVGEQSDWGNGQRNFKEGAVDAVYAFPLWNAIGTLDPSTLTREVRAEASVVPKGKTELIFLENHDVDRYASRVMDDPVVERYGAVLNLTLKGTPSIYYGQEIGMNGKGGSWNSDGNDIPRRLAFRWNKSIDAPGTATWYKDTGPWSSTEYSHSNDGISVEEEVSKPDSLLAFYRKLIKLRRSSLPLSQGSQQLVDAISPGVVAFERRWRNESVFVFVNDSNEPVRFTMSRPTKGVRSLTDLWTGKPYGIRQKGVLTIPIQLVGHGFLILSMR